MNYLTKLYGLLSIVTSSAFGDNSARLKNSKFGKDSKYSEIVRQICGDQLRRILYKYIYGLYQNLHGWKCHNGSLLTSLMKVPRLDAQSTLFSSVFLWQFYTIHKFKLIANFELPLTLNYHLFLWRYQEVRLLEINGMIISNLKEAGH